MRQRISPGPDYAGPRRRDGRCDDAGHGAGGRVDLKLGHHASDGIEVIDVHGEIDIYTAPRLRELLIDLAGTGSYQLVVNLDQVGFLDSTGLGVLVGGLKRVHPTADPEDLDDHRADGGLRHLPDRGPGHRGHQGPPVRNAGLAGVGAETAPDQVDAAVRSVIRLAAGLAGVEDIRLS